jgi:hypothetical protein
LEVVLKAFDVCAGITFELGFDPVDGLAIAIRSLPPIAELRQPLDGGLISFQIEPIDENFLGVRNYFRLGLRRGRAAGTSDYVWDKARHKDASRGNHHA